MVPSSSAAFASSVHGTFTWQVTLEEPGLRRDINGVLLRIRASVEGRVRLHTLAVIVREPVPLGVY